MANSDQKRQLKDIIPDINKAVRFLEACDDYATEETFGYLSQIHEYFESCDDPIALAKYITDKSFGLLFPKIWKALSGYLYGNQWETQGFRNISRISFVFTYLTNYSSEMGISLGSCGSIALMFETLERIQACSDTEIEHVRFNILCILDNSIRLCSSNRGIYRNANAVSILTGHLELDTESQALSLMILVYIVNDTESGILASSQQGVRFLTNYLKEAVRSSAHKGYIPETTANFSAFELLDAINHLAINDDNKAIIEKEGVIPDIIRMLQDDFSEEEQRVAAEALWNLAFIEAIRQSELLQGITKTLKNLMKTRNKDLRGACASALFQISGYNTVESPPDAGTPQGSPPSYEEAISEPVRPRNSAQIMVSYQWDSQQLALQIKDKLLEAGYKVWMDVTNMRGDILSAMADAVQTSDIILMCMTEKYKDSKSCRSEATYAYKLQKKVIPLLLEDGYRPDGWLGLVQGMDLYYDFHSEIHLQSNMANLLTAISECQPVTDTTDGPVVEVSEETAQSTLPPKADTPTKNPVSNWSKEDVQVWLKDNDLIQLCQTLKRCNGKHLKRMYAKFCKDEDKFEEELKTDYKMDAQTRTEFVVALEDACKVD